MEKGATPSRPRRYDASRRQAEAEVRRRRIVEAAHRLFLEEGYGATSIKAIADAAGVSAPTVYAQFESKAGILGRVVEAAVAGDYEDAGLARERPDVAALFGPGMSARDRIRAGAAAAAQLHARSADVLALLHAVAQVDESVRAQAEHLAALSYSDMEAVATTFDPADLRPGLDRDGVARILCAITSFEVFRMLTGRLGLSLDEYADWVDQRMTNLLLPDAPG